jgi:signal transduction histidine kinase
MLRRVTLGVLAAWLLGVAGVGTWVSQQLTTAWLERLAASARHEADTTARVVDRLFTQMDSVANMVANQAQVIQLASRYRRDPPGAAAQTRAQRAEAFTRDPQVRKVGDFMDALAADLRYARIYMNNLSDDTVTASNWAQSDSIVGMIYTGRTYLNDALRHGAGQSFGIARLNRSPSYFVARRIEGNDNTPLGSVTVKFDAPDMAHYLTGQHIALIVNRQGRVTTASAPTFMLRNVAALLPPGFIQPSEDGEASGDAMDIRAMPRHVGQNGQARPWRIEGTPWLVHRQALHDTQYQLLTLAALDPLAGMHRQHLIVALLVAAFGAVLIGLAGHATRQMALRRQHEIDAARHTQALNVELSAALADAKTKDRQKTEVLGYVSHDLRAPLTAIRGHAALLATEPPAHQPRLLHAIERSVQYQLSLIDDLLECARSELQPLAVQPSATDLPRLLADICDYAAALCAQQHNRFCQRFSGHLPRHLMLDGKRLQQVLLNLLSNAAKFTHGGVVTLAVDARPEGDACALLITVSDTGMGMDLAQGADIFDAFSQVNTKSDGAGLGLFIAQRIALAIGGVLTVNSAPGQGTSFSLALCAPAIGAFDANWASTMPEQTRQPAAPTLPAHAMPDDQALAELAHLARNGRLSDIEHWLARHAREAAHAPFATLLQDMLDRFDFVAIEALALHGRVSGHRSA